MSYINEFQTIRQHTLAICQPLEIEDFVLQPILEVSPPKWHLGHTTWFFETFILKPNLPTYIEFDHRYNFLFNSYYETIGERINRQQRGTLSRPTVNEVMMYRRHVDKFMIQFLSDPINEELIKLLRIGLNHEQQHQELLMSDIKYILGHNPLFPIYAAHNIESTKHSSKNNKPIICPEGVYEIGYGESEFCFDNEKRRHKVYLPEFAIDSALTTNEAFLQFILTGGYEDFRFWHSEAWEWIQKNNIRSPLYWHLIENEWQEYTLSGLQPLELHQPVCHISYYEASAFANWAGMRLPTEAEWEAAADQFDWGARWEWTNSAYLPYPGFEKSEGAIGEYNGKFMINQMVLRGGSIATPKDHSRKTYRNFFHPDLRWQFTGIRLAQTIPNS